jgi:outer membrane murein-binding lipoprotein Lpp
VTGPKRLGLVGVAGLAAALALNACSSSTTAGSAASNVADLNAKFEQAISEKPTVITLPRAMDRR